jgi:hypothetical protein
MQIFAEKMLATSDPDEQDHMKKVGGIQLNFPGTSLLLLDWKYSKGTRVPCHFTAHVCFYYKIEPNLSNAIGSLACLDPVSLPSALPFHRYFSSHILPYAGMKRKYLVYF